MRYDDRRLQSALAAEYVLGTLHGAARRRFERLLVSDFNLRREVEHWANALYPGMVDTLPEQRPPASLWRAIAKRTRPAREARDRGLWRNLVFWRAWGTLATAALLALGLVFGPQWLREPVVLEHLAVINDREARPAWLVRAGPQRIHLEVEALQAQAIEPDRSFELWVLPGEERPPRSLGLLPPRGETTLALSRELGRVLAGAAGLAVSLEPRGGSPTGLPTGPVLYQGGLIPPG